jgi:hypothetical protein
MWYLKKEFLKKMFIVVLIVILGLGSAYFFVEETTEKLIKNETGIDIDLTPESPESKEN